MLLALCKIQTKHDQIRDGNIEICILHKIFKILVYNTSGHQIFYHIPKFGCYITDYLVKLRISRALILQNTSRWLLPFSKKINKLIKTVWNKTVWDKNCCIFYIDSMISLLRLRLFNLYYLQYYKYEICPTNMTVNFQ